jgi:hypothetical protein
MRSFLLFIGILLSPLLTTSFAPLIGNGSHPRVSFKTSLNEGLLDDLLSGAFGKAAPKNNGPQTIMEIPASQLKIGALRFLLQIYLVGEQNKPTPKSWFTKQGDALGDLQVYYQDGTGMLSIELEVSNIRFVRHGEKPSLQYRLQESVLLHGVLDELANVALETTDIEVEKRLLCLADAGAIDKARRTLPARPTTATGVKTESDSS